MTLYQVCSYFTQDSSLHNTQDTKIVDVSTLIAAKLDM